ncbi:MAG: hypothetical protein N3A01_08590 [Bacteroidales bacterium]|nr:hypothetical protein [Bacteroidales bacterium]
MILVIDSGSTKTDWAFIKSKNEVRIIRTVGLNPYDISYEDFAKVVKEIQKKINLNELEKVVFYGAGCGNDENKKKIKQFFTTSLKRNICITVETDLLGIAHATLKNTKGWVAILGTGSNVGYFDGCNIIKFTPSTGFIIGDEGSSVHIAKLFLRNILYNRVSDKVKKEFFEKANVSVSDIIAGSVSSDAKNFLSSFSKIVYLLKEYAEVKTLICNAFEEFISIHLLPFYKNKEESVNFGGSISYYFKEELLSTLKKNKIKIGKIVRRPIIKLVKYYAYEL